MEPAYPLRRSDLGEPSAITEYEVTPVSDQELDFIASPSTDPRRPLPWIQS